MKEKIKLLEDELSNLKILCSTKQSELTAFKNDYAKKISDFKVGDKVRIVRTGEIIIIKDITLDFNEPRYWYARIKKNGEPYNECRKIYFYDKMELVK